MTSGWSFTSRAGSGDGDDDGDEMTPSRPSYAAPDNEIPAVVATEKVLAASDDVVFFLAGIRVYTNGMEFELEARVRPGVRIGETAGVYELLSDCHAPRHGGGESLLLGVEYADARRGTNVQGIAHGGLTLAQHGSSGGGRGAHATYFLSPLPPPGEIRLVCALPSAGIEETVTVLDADEILAAAARVRELWPWEPERPEPYQPLPPRLPDGGWFATLRAAQDAETGD